ncbi:unnamed protein product [Porites lobata]|uniref:ZMYM2-like/QRICH1 C-terminal domain-containing protein n=1 Tax=Porites lobata TaxID=104759 RepID=A0ABN8QE52_9CNID|nr:unnamed protein product [Porites lobata]
MASRFKDLDVSVEDFISEQENESTKKKTLQNVAVLQQFLASKNEERKLEEIPPEELNEYLSEFIITVRTKDKQDEYEPSSLRGFIASFERYLKRKITTTYKFSTRKKLLGTERPEALLNTLWLNNTTQFGLRGCKEHRDMCWGDVKLKKTSTGVEFLEYGERQTKTRLGDDTNDVRPIAPKMFSLPNSDRCPVLTYKVFAEKRPTQMNFDEAPNLQSVNNYATVSEKQQMKMSRTLSAFTTGIVSKKDAPREESSCGSSSENNKMLVSQQRTEHTVTSSTCGQQQSATNFRWSYDKRWKHSCFDQHTQQITYIADKPEA